MRSEARTSMLKVLPPRALGVRQERGTGLVWSIICDGPAALSALKKPDRVEIALNNWVATVIGPDEVPVMARVTSKGEIPDWVAPTVVDWLTRLTDRVVGVAPKAGADVVAMAREPKNRTAVSAAIAARNPVVNQGATRSDARRCGRRRWIEVP